MVETVGKGKFRLPCLGNGSAEITGLDIAGLDIDGLAMADIFCQLEVEQRLFVSNISLLTPNIAYIKGVI